MSIYKAYDIRGIYPDEINERSLTPAVLACATIFSDGKIIIGHDGRHGSSELADFVAKKIIEKGSGQGKKFTVEQIGLSTTPMFYFFVIELEASGGLMITASHNPKNYNGLKIVKKGAEPISGTELEKIVSAEES